MKLLVGLRDKLRPPNSRTPDQDIPTFLDIAIDSTQHMKVGEKSRGIDSIRLFKLALKLEQLKDPYSIENYEFEQIKESCEKNPAGYLAWAHGQMMLKILEWEKQNNV